MLTSLDVSIVGWPQLMSANITTSANHILLITILITDTLGWDKS
jgi:hypothetical protein